MTTRLLLLGGGHAHVEVIRRLRIATSPHLAVRLVSPNRHTAYSGMLPGAIAGHYAYADYHIDLAALCRSGDIAFSEAAATALDLAARCVRVASGEVHRYDLLSIDIGAASPAGRIPGAGRHALPVRPVGAFLNGWNRAIEAGRTRHVPYRIVIVGGGTAAVELALAMHHRLSVEGNGAAPQVELIADAPSVPADQPPGVRRLLGKVLAARGIMVHSGSRATCIAPGLVHHAKGVVAADLIVLATGPAPHGWLAASGLALDREGYIAVTPALQSASHPAVFAAGDTASMIGHPRPKSGVYAVREGPILATNLLRAASGTPLLHYRPQNRALALIGTGNHHAVGSWHGVGFAGKWVWHWKQCIDRRFVARYRVTR